MNAQDERVRAAIEQLVPAAGKNDWSDVLRRAGARPRSGVLPVRSNARRLALALVTLALVAVPALAATNAGTFAALWKHHGPSIGLSTKLEDAHGTPAGTVDMRLPGVFVTTDRTHHLVPHLGGRLGSGIASTNAYRLTWQLELGSGIARQGELAYRPRVAHAGRAVARLCRPCHTGDSGEVPLTRQQAALLVNGQLQVVFDTDSGRLSEVVRLEGQRGLRPPKG